MERICCWLGMYFLALEFGFAFSCSFAFQITAQSETVVLYSVCGIDMPCGFLLWPPQGVTPIPLSPHTFISETELLGINCWGFNVGDKMLGINSSQKPLWMTPIELGTSSAIKIQGQKPNGEYQHQYQNISNSFQHYDNMSLKTECLG